MNVLKKIKIIVDRKETMVIIIIVRCINQRHQERRAKKMKGVDYSWCEKITNNVLNLEKRELEEQALFEYYNRKIKIQSKKI